MTRAERLRAVAPLGVTIGMFALFIGVALSASADSSFQLGLATSAFVLAIAAWAVLQAVVGTVIAWRRPDNRVGRLMQASGPLLISVFLGYLVGAWRFVVAGPQDLLGALAAWWGSVAVLGSIFVAFPLLGLIFPDGRLPSPRFTWPLRFVIAGMVVPTAIHAIAIGPVDAELGDNRIGLVTIAPEFREFLNLVSTVALISGCVLAIAGIVVRWRRGDRLQRAQLKWLLAAFGIGSVLLAASWAGPDDELADLLDFLSIVGVMLVPIAIGIAVLRYRLYEIDRLVSRTITYGLVTAVLFAVFTSVAIVMGSAIGATGNDSLTTAVSTLVAAALFNPVRARIQRLVDRRFNRARYDAERTAIGFAGRLRHQLELPMLSEELRRATTDAVEPRATAVWLRPRGSR